MKTKYIDKRSWRRLLRSDYKEIRVDDDMFDGIIGLITMQKVKSPLQVEVVDKYITVADIGYKWLQILPKGKPYSITAMYDQYDRILQYYIDVNDENVIEPGEARTHDLFLDVLVLPDGRYELVDEADLKRALRTKDITKAQFDEAYRVAEELMNYIDNDFEAFKERIEYCRQKIASSMS